MYSRNLCLESMANCVFTRKFEILFDVSGDIDNRNKSCDPKILEP